MRQSPLSLLRTHQRARPPFRRRHKSRRLSRRRAAFSRECSEGSKSKTRNKPQPLQPQGSSVPHPQPDRRHRSLLRHRCTRQVFIRTIENIHTKRLASVQDHNPHYDVLAAAVSGTAATMLTLLAMLGGGGADTLFLKMLFDAQLFVVELAMITGIAGLLKGGEMQKRMLSHGAAILLIVGTVLLSIGAAIL